MAHHTDAGGLSEKELERRERRHIRRKWHWGTFKHTLVVIFTLLLAVVATVVMVAGQYFLGPSQAASDKLTQTLHQSSALKFIPYLYLYEHVGEALERGETLSPDEVTDSSLVTVVARQPKEYASDDSEQEQFDENGIRLVEVNGATFHGYMMIVQDPSRVKLGVCATPFSDARPGRRVDEIMKDYGAIAGMNGGAFHDCLTDPPYRKTRPACWRWTACRTPATWARSCAPRTQRALRALTSAPCARTYIPPRCSAPPWAAASACPPCAASSKRP